MLWIGGTKVDSTVFGRLIASFFDGKMKQIRRVKKKRKIRELGERKKKVRRSGKGKRNEKKAKNS